MFLCLSSSRVSSKRKDEEEANAVDDLRTSNLDFFAPILFSSFIPGHSTRLRRMSTYLHQKPRKSMAIFLQLKGRNSMKK